MAAVRPRVSSLFEPARSPEVSPANLSEPRPGPSSLQVGEEPDASVPSAEPRATFPNERAARRQKATRATSESPGASLIPRSDFSDPTSRSAADPLSLPQPVHGWMGLESFAEPAPDARLVQPARSQEQRADMRPGPSSPAAASNDAVRSGDTPPAHLASTAVPRAAEVEAHRLLIPTRLDAEIASDLQRSVSAWSSKRRERPEVSESAAMDRATQSERNVHVTIGRIEVRATGVQKAPVREPAVPPVMSLDEYLRRQSQRGAR